jgi:hypothetical protein
MFDGWSSFFALTGSAGAGLIGLLFVVVTLGARLVDIPKAGRRTRIDDAGVD